MMETAQEIEAAAKYEEGRLATEAIREDGGMRSFLRKTGNRIRNGWMFEDWTVMVFMWAIFLLAGMSIERMYTNPTLRDLKLVERACGYENVKVRTVHELGIATAIFSCERVAQ